MSSQKTKRSLSLKELSGNKEQKKQEKCIDVAPTITQAFATHEDMVRVTSRLDELQASIDRLLDMCLQAEQGDSLVEEQL